MSLSYPKKVDYVALAHSNAWQNPDGSPLPLSKDIIKQMLAALPKKLCVDANDVIQDIQLAAFHFVFFGEYRKARPRSWNASKKFWENFRKSVVPTHELFKRLTEKTLAPIEIGKGRSIELSSQELVDLETMALPFAVSDKATLPPQLSLEKELIRTRELLGWLLEVIPKLEAQMAESGARKQQSPRNDFVRELGRAWSRATGHWEIPIPRNDPSAGGSRSTFLDFASPAIAKLTGLKWEGIATLIKRTLEADRARSPIGTKPNLKKRGPKSKSSLDGLLGNLGNSANFGTGIGFAGLKGPQYDNPVE
jgi:hypothetical protein